MLFTLVLNLSGASVMNTLKITFKCRITTTKHEPSLLVKTKAYSYCLIVFTAPTTSRERALFAAAHALKICHLNGCHKRIDADQGACYYSLTAACHTCSSKIHELNKSDSTWIEKKRIIRSQSLR